MHLVGFIIRIYHDARSPERQMYDCICCCCRLVYNNVFFWDVAGLRRVVMCVGFQLSVVLQDRRC